MESDIDHLFFRFERHAHLGWKPTTRCDTASAFANHDIVMGRQDTAAVQTPIVIDEPPAGGIPTTERRRFRLLHILLVVEGLVVAVAGVGCAATLVSILRD